MNDDKKVDFYLEHYKEIEEWAALRDVVVNRLKESLNAAFEDQLRNDDSLPEMRNHATNRGLWQLGNSAEAYVELTWLKDADLFRSNRRPLPFLAICGGPPHKEALRGLTKDVAKRNGFVKGQGTYWVWTKEMHPDKFPFNIEEYAERCVQALADLWQAVEPKMSENVASLQQVTLSLAD